MVQYGCKAAADLVHLLQISKAEGGLPVLVYRTKLFAGHQCTIHNPKKIKQALLFYRKVTERI